MKWTIVLLVIPLIINSCKAFPTARVGNTLITKKTIESLSAIESAYGAQHTPEELLLAAIQRGIDIELAMCMGIDLSDSVLRAESIRIDRETKAPHILMRIKQHFQHKPKDYLNTFVKPVLARRRIEELFFYDTTLYQKTPWTKANKLLAYLQEHGRFPDSITPIFSIQASNPKTKNFYNFIRNIAQLEIKGEVFPHPIEDKYTYFVVRCSKKKDGMPVYEGVAIPKENFYEFYWNFVDSLPISIYNKELKEHLLTRVKGTRWEKILQED